MAKCLEGLSSVTPITLTSLTPITLTSLTLITLTSDSHSSRDAGRGRSIRSCTGVVTRVFSFDVCKHQVTGGAV